jgi:hypothetical protein
MLLLRSFTVKNKKIKRLGIDCGISRREVGEGEQSRVFRKHNKREFSGELRTRKVLRTDMVPLHNAACRSGPASSVGWRLISVEHAYKRNIGSCAPIGGVQNTTWLFALLS